eukprot:CAMPEP_0114690686 /NCGR_PEP_ID=MMETSP0191-20121206/65974_1 /TAXON_ID=126664 /ORGANISM="Sorites sp." /LENGTH=87 /DNA_ID=CAMNT_0001980913 /DNA_START=212 /DNA_END=475 /DNA_ORIENTATION=-
MAKDLEPTGTARSSAERPPTLSRGPLPLGTGPPIPTAGLAVPGSPVPQERWERSEIRLDLEKDPKFMPQVPMMVVGTPSPKQADALM